MWTEDTSLSLRGGSGQEKPLGFIGIEIGFEPMTLDEFIKKVSVD